MLPTSELTVRVPPFPLQLKEGCTGGDEMALFEEVDNKIQNMDFFGARALIENTNIKFIPEMLAACDILCASNLEFPGYGIDWYWVLQIFPTSDLETIEAKYQKLLSQLKVIPDGFRSRESALQIIQAAYSVLSIPLNRASFNHKRDHAWKQLDNSTREIKGEALSRNGVAFPVTETSTTETTIHNLTSFGRLKGPAHGEILGNKVLQPALSDSHRHDVKSSSSPKASCSGESGSNHLNCHSINAIPDEQMVNLRAKWSINDFMAEQVWAVYDIGSSPLPRFYAKVIDVVPPNRVRVAFLEPNPRLEEEIHWVEEGLPVACGIFRMSRDVVDIELTRFSHVVKCELSSGRTFYRIYPRKGEIWALHKNWHSNWKPSDYGKRWCQIVEILSDFSIDDSCKVCSLVEVDGYVTFFKRRLFEESLLVKKFMWSEMLSFSHQIPAYIVVGVEDRRIPKVSWHLEPDALPLKVDSSCNVA